MKTTKLKGEQTTQPGADDAAKRARPLAGFLIAGASLAALFGLAVLKGRVKDDSETPREARN
ncbi:MAG TPA: hypothetical protein VF538_10870 [Pyrinomonadaceae bacterium]|jgi:hypothetical protein